MVSSPVLSVIIPFYNETAFLTTAVNSVLSQGITGIEVIIVNDNPDTYSKEYFDTLGFPACVRVLHHPQNRGLPSSRNTGIEAALGEYIAFLDADDYYLPLGLRKQLHYAMRTGADITHAQTMTTNVNRVSGEVHQPDATYLNRDRRGLYRKADVIEAGFFVESSWASIYSAAFLKGKNIRFDESQVKFEDRIFVIEALLAADSFAILGEPCRVWRRRKNSITTSAKSLNDQFMKMDMVRKSVDLWLSKCPQYARHRAMCEFVRQVGYMITKNENSPWYGAFGFGDTEGDRKLTEMLSEYFASLSVHEHEIIAAFDAKSPKYAPEQSGNGKITPQDLFRFIDAVAEQDYETAQDIVNSVLKRPRPFTMSQLPKLKKAKIRILLHAGLHKTGTTHIQHQLAHNRDVLRDNGILFPKAGFGFVQGKEPVRDGGLPGHQALITSVFQSDGTLIKALKEEIQESNCHTVVISAENLSQPGVPYAARARRIRKLAKSLQHVGQVTPIFMYRQPDSWLESYYREISSNGAPLAYQTPGEFLMNNMGILDFGAIVGAAEEACSNKAVLFSFEDALRDYDDLTFAFLDKCGLNVPHEQITLAEGTRYPSPCNAQLEIARITSLLVQDQSTRQNILRTFYSLAEDSGQKHRLFTPQERRQIVNLFCDRAEALFADRGIADPRAAWLEGIRDDETQSEAIIPASYFDKLRVAGVMSGPLTEPVEPVPDSKLEKAPLKHVTEVSLHDWDRISRNIQEAEALAAELNYMRNSVSWRITAPLRSVMRRWRNWESKRQPAQSTQEA